MGDDNLYNDKPTCFIMYAVVMVVVLNIIFILMYHFKNHVYNNTILKQNATSNAAQLSKY